MSKIKNKADKYDKKGMFSLIHSNLFKQTVVYLNYINIVN